MENNSKNGNSQIIKKIIWRAIIAWFGRETTFKNDMKQIDEITRDYAENIGMCQMKMSIILPK